MVDVSGHSQDKYAPVREVFASHIESGNELGGSLTIDIDGETVLDVWGGWADADRTEPWTERTITNVWSSTKTVTSLAALMLVDRGQLDPYAPVAKYWPEFAQNGKDGVEVRHLMSHTSGVPGWELPFAAEDMYDYDSATERLAAQAPWWEPGTASGYQANNYGNLVGELVRRVTGKSLKRFVADDIAGPLGADFQIGARQSDWGRIAPVVPPPPLEFDLDAMDPDSPAYKVFMGPAPDASRANTPAWRNADMGAHNGHGNARSLCAIMKAVTLGGIVDGVSLLSADTIDLVFDEQVHGVDLVLGAPLRFGIGYALPETATLPYVPQGKACYWGGWGGSLVIMDLDTRTTFSYMMNKMGSGILGNDRSEAYMHAFDACR